MPVRYILSIVWVRLSIFSPLSIIQFIIQYVGMCVFNLPTPLVMIEIIYILCLIIIIKSEVWTITHCLGLGHETTVCAVCLSIFLWRFWHIRYVHNRLFNDLNKVGLPGPTCQVNVIKFGTNVGLKILIDINYRFYDNHEESFGEFFTRFPISHIVNHRQCSRYHIFSGVIFKRGKGIHCLKNSIMKVLLHWIFA